MCVRDVFAVTSKTRKCDVDGEVANVIGSLHFPGKCFPGELRRLFPNFFSL